MNLVSHHDHHSDSSMLQTVESMSNNHNVLLQANVPSLLPSSPSSSQATAPASSDDCASVLRSSGNLEDAASRWNNLAVELALLSVATTGNDGDVRGYELLMEGVVSLRKALEAVRRNCILRKKAH